MASCTTTFPHPVQLAQYASPIGRMTLAASPDGLVGAWFVGQKYEPCFLPQPPEDEEASHCLALAARWLDCYFGKAEPDQFPALPLGGGGITPFPKPRPAPHWAADKPNQHRKTPGISPFWEIPGVLFGVSGSVPPPHH